MYCRKSSLSSTTKIVGRGELERGYGRGPVARQVYLLDYLVLLNPNRASQVQGLLGNYDGDPRNDLVHQNGQPSSGRFEDLYPHFADSWRITQANSLFVYEPG